MRFAKRCKVCGKIHSLTEFLELALPANGIAVAHGLHWRNCACGGTLVVPEEELTRLTSATEAA